MPQLYQVQVYDPRAIRALHFTDIPENEIPEEVVAILQSADPGLTVSIIINKQPEAQ